MAIEAISDFLCACVRFGDAADTVTINFYTMFLVLRYTIICTDNSMSDTVRLSFVVSYFTNIKNLYFGFFSLLPCAFSLLSALQTVLSSRVGLIQHFPEYCQIYNADPVCV